MARGATWDPDLEERIGDAIGRELRALGGNLFGGVCINLLRHPAWGRAQETYGEDPYHLGALGAALDARRAAPRDGLRQALRLQLDGERPLHRRRDGRRRARCTRSTCPTSSRVVDEGVASRDERLQQRQRRVVRPEPRAAHRASCASEWGFDGFVLTDFIFGMRDARAAALAGLDVEMPFRFLLDAADLPAWSARGAVPVERRRRTRRCGSCGTQVRFGQGRDPAALRPGSGGLRRRTGRWRARRRTKTRRAAQRASTALRAAADAGVRRLAVIGRLAATPNTGDGGSSDVRPAYVVTPLEGLRAALGAGVGRDV